MIILRPKMPPASLTARMVAKTAVVTGCEIRLPRGVLFPEIDPNLIESAATPTSVAPPLLGAAAAAAGGAPPGRAGGRGAVGGWAGAGFGPPPAGGGGGPRPAAGPGA